MKLVIWLLVVLSAVPAFGQSNAWWINFKRQNGLPPGLIYNDWVRQGCPLPRAPARPAPGPSPEQVAADAERQKIEEERQRIEDERLQQLAERKRKADLADKADQDGLQAMQNRNWNWAANKFMEALEFAPDNAAIRAHLDQANAAIADAAATAEILALRNRIQNSMATAKTAALAQALKDDIASQRLAAIANVFRRQTENDEAAAIFAGVSKIQVPVPVPPEDAVIAFGQLAPDEKSKWIVSGLDDGVAAIDVFGKLGNAALPGKLLLVTGKTFIAAEDGADVYLTKQNETYDRALAYLKDPKQRQQFSEIVRDLRENRPLPESASIDMQRAAQAIIDPKLGNSATHIAWDAMLSTEARRAALTRACIEMGGALAGKLAGEASKKLAPRILAVQDPAFQEASDFLHHAQVALARVKDPEAIETLTLAVAQANSMIAASYRVAHPTVNKLAENVGELLFTESREKAAEKSFEERKR